MTEPEALGGRATLPVAVYAAERFAWCGLLSGLAIRVLGGCALPHCCQSSDVKVSQRVASHWCSSAVAVEARPANTAVLTTVAVWCLESCAAASWCAETALANGQRSQ